MEVVCQTYILKHATALYLVIKYPANVIFKSIKPLSVVGRCGGSGSTSGLKHSLCQNYADALSATPGEA